MAEAAPTPITVAWGDGIGPEIMAAALSILGAAGARIAIETIQIGESVYLGGITSGIAPDAWESLRRTRVLLKSPITTPQGKGYKSLNVTLRKSLGLYANVRPCTAYAPFVPTRHPDMNLVIIRENEEDLYAGIEHRQTDEVTQCLKIITRPGCEKITRYAFDYARQNQKRKITCMTKDNIMKMTDGLFRQVFESVGAAEYPEIEREHLIVDIGAARLADTPERFEMILAPNLYGDILSDIAAQIAGSVGLAGSANIGDSGAMFEAIHGSAPDIAGKNIANPSGLLQGAVLMLHHIGQGEIAQRIQNAWLCTLEEGIHTADIFRTGVSKERVGTREFADAVIARLGSMPQKLPPAPPPISMPDHKPSRVLPATVEKSPRSHKERVGIDVFLDWRGGSPDDLGRLLTAAQSEGNPLRLSMITNRGVKVWPQGLPETFCVDHWRCRFIPADPATDTVSQEDILGVLTAVVAGGFDFIKCENLYRFDGVPGYALGQGQ